MTKRKAEAYTPPQPKNLANIVLVHGGRVYGSWPVLLTRGTEVRLGTRMGRYGGVMCATEANPFEEQSDSWWNADGWQITDPPIPATVTP
jgi:hypothetical protein